VLGPVLGDWDRAEEHFEKALKVNRKMHAWPWLAWTRHDYSRMLRRRGRYKDAENADKLLEITLDAAARLNMIALTKAIVGRTH